MEGVGFLIKYWYWENIVKFMFPVHNRHCLRCYIKYKSHQFGLWYLMPLSTIFQLYRGGETSHQNYPLDHVREKGTLKGNITLAPSMKNGTRNGLSGFIKQQHHKVQWFYKQFVKWDIFRYDAIHQDNIYM